MDDAKRDAIVKAAGKSFLKQGYAASSIEQIAAEAGVSKVTIYNHFGGKRVLFEAAVDRECARIRNLLTFQAADDGPIRDRLRVIGEAMVTFLSRPEMVQFERRIAAEMEQHPDVGKAFLEAGPYRMKAAFSAFLEQAVARGELDVPNTRLAVEQFVSMCKGMGDMERRLGVPLKPKENLERVIGAVEVFLKAYTAKAR